MVKTLVSVIVPVYNSEKHLEECLNSVKYQTLKNIEILCINDGSKDRSLEILQKYAMNDNRFKIISKENQGVWSARNLGISIAKSDYIYFLDSDDFLDLSLLEKLYEKSIKNDLDICVCKSRKLNMITQQSHIIDYAIHKDYLPSKNIFSSKDIHNKIFYLFVGWPWDKLYKKNLIIENNILFPELKNSEDTYFVYYALILSKRISILEEDSLYTYRFSGNSSISTSRELEPDAFIKSMDLLKKRLDERDLYDDYSLSFLCYFITFSIWHLKTISIDYKDFLYEKVKQYALKTFKEIKDDFLSKVLEYYKESSFIEYINIIEKEEVNKKLFDYIKEI